jgi:putative ABC transport system permease protein
MLKNYLKIAFRNLWRNKSTSAINIIGLAIGIATCLIIVLFIQNELSYDRYNEKADQIVRVVFRGTAQGGKMNEANVMPPTASTLKADYPEVLEATRIRSYGQPRISNGEKSFRNSSFAFVDANFFQVFTLPLIKGNANTALLKPNSIVITSLIAQKYFGNEDPIGKELTFKDWNITYLVTGVIDKVPANSHFHFDLFASMTGYPDANNDSWMVSEFFTYLVLPRGYDYKKLEAKLPEVVEKYMGPQLQKSMGMSLKQFREKGNDIGLFLQPLTDIHLNSDFSYDLEAGADIHYLYIFGSIAVFMLIIACINFMNLSTAGASKRAREVGIRKVLGSAQLQLVLQFLVESILLTLIASLLAIELLYLALPVFNEIAGKHLSFQIIENPWIGPGLLIFILVTGLLAGSYPAFFLSSFKPVAVLKGRFLSGNKSIGLRSSLVVFQFIISITLIVSTIVVFKQLSYIQNKKLGYEKEQVLVIQETNWLGKNEVLFRQELLKDPRIKNVSLSGYLPAGPSFNNNFFVSPGNNPSQIIKTLRYDVDENYIPALRLKLIEGRNFSTDLKTDSASVILNETAARELGWNNHALDKIITRSNNEGNKASFRVIGIVQDFHFKSLHDKISPLVMVLGNNSGTMIAKISTTDIPGLLTSIEKKWVALKAEEPFAYSFLDERFNKTYQTEQKTGFILSIFAGLTIFVACLGLFGLAKFTAEQRTKEIGIRKVLGASASGIVNLLSKDFLKLVAIAFLVAAPISWLIMNKWLEDFAYRISINIWVFIVAAIAAISIALLTVSIQSLKAAFANPVKSLKTE